MSQTTAEILILAINALGAGILLFVAGVIQNIMDQMDAADFKRFMNLLSRSAMSNPFAVTIATLPIIAAVFYFLAFGFKHWWFTAGFGAWITLASVALMACEFSVRGVIIVVVISVLATPPLVWLARRYIPG